ncbi:MAG: hypothetical protein WC867_04355 [Candidatus Pacearchaeota archaeon]|jgi:hypothetical protein
MKRGIIGIFFLFLILNSLLVLAVVAECSDSDSGKDIFEKGTVIDINQVSNTDECYQISPISGQKGVKEYYCNSDGTSKYIEQGCTYDCIDGACTRGSYVCNDDDVNNEYPDGKNFYEKGIAIFDFINQTDICIDYQGYNIQEAICLDNYSVGSQFYKCPNGCKDGACINATSCTDSDYGKEFYKQGSCKSTSTEIVDACITGGEHDSELREGYCNSENNCVFYPFKCPNGCKDGVCITMDTECFDSDNGIDIFTKGYAKDATGVHNDFCSDSKKIGEKICKDGKNYIEYKDCPEGYSCKDGVCLSGTITNLEKIKLNEKFKITLKESKFIEENIKFQFKEIGPNGEAVVKLYNKKPESDSILNLIELRLHKGKKFEYSGYYIELLELNDNTATIIIGKYEVIKENVKCIFKNSENEEKCYTASFTNKEDFRFDCAGITGCDVEINGFGNQKISWKSSCGGYALSSLDGVNEEIIFDCSKGASDIDKIRDKMFRYMYYKCYNGKEEKQGSESSCKPSELWQEYAKEACKDNCNEESGKCGVNSFSVHEDCYDDTNDAILLDCDISDLQECCKLWADENKIDYPTCEGGWNIENNICHYSCKAGEKIIPEDVLVCKDSCPLEGKCYQFGYRKSSKYCTDMGSFEDQLSGNNACENNFECKSNVCVSGKCVSQGMIDKVLAWFRNVFGKDE